VATRRCTSCIADGAVGALDAAGAALPADPVDVPPGATLVLGWAVSEGTVDAGAGIDVLGPARVRALDAGGRAALFVESGAAIADATHDLAVESAHARTTGANASWRVAVSAAGTHIEVLRGEVVIEARGQAARTLHAGERVDLAARPTLAAPPAPASAPPKVDVPKAPRAPAPPPPALSADPPPVGTTDDDAAFEAASAAARNTARDTERAAVWRRYLERPRPAPHADVAMATLANVLLDMGSVVEARVVVDAALARPSVPQAAAALESARARLAASRAEECLDHDLRKLPRVRKH
jgi:hypothetical protein